MESVSLKDNSLPKVKVHPTVVFSILNSFTRRVPRDSRIIGTLLGEVRDGVVVVTDCFAVPFTEKTDELVIAFDSAYHKKMYSFHRRYNRKEVVVGWYTTTTAQGQFINDNSYLINNMYRSECENPIHLVVDTTLIGDSMNVRGFVNNSVTVNGEVLASSFQELKVDDAMSEGEASCLFHMINNQEGEQWSESSIVSSLPTAADTVETSILQLQKVLDSAQAYVDAVVEGNPNATVSREIGIQLAETLSTFAAQRTGAQQASAMQTRLQDLTMVSYISTLAQTQALISEKLNEILV